MGNVVISPNIKKTSERIDFNGNVIDPKTKQILVPKEVESILPPPNPTPPEPIIAPTTQVHGINDPMDVQRQIEETKAHLVLLEKQKKEQIEEMEKALNALKQQ